MSYNEVNGLLEREADNNNSVIPCKELSVKLSAFPRVRLANDGMTKMVVTHEMGFAKKAADRVVFLDEGKIVEDATKDDFFRSPRIDRAQLFLSKTLSH